MGEIKNDAVLNSLKYFHAFMLGFGIDMDFVQKKVHDSVPAFTITRGAIVYVVSLFIWTSLFSVVHY